MLLLPGLLRARVLHTQPRVLLQPLKMLVQPPRMLQPQRQPRSRPSKDAAAAAVKGVQGAAATAAGGVGKAVQVVKSEAGAVSAAVTKAGRHMLGECLWVFWDRGKWNLN